MTGSRLAGKDWSASNTALAVAALLSLYGCGAPEAGPSEGPSPSEARRVVLGTGEAEFESMDGEPQLRLVAGVQGGFHVWASFLAYGFTASNLAMVLTTSVEEAPESRIPLRATLPLRETVDDQGELAHAFAGFPAQVHDARCAHGKRVRLDISLSDGDGTAEDTRYCVAVVDEARRSLDCP